MNAHEALYRSKQLQKVAQKLYAITEQITGLDWEDLRINENVQQARAGCLSRSAYYRGLAANPDQLDQELPF